MNTVANNIEPRIKQIEVTEDTITAYLTDGRMIGVPLAWSWRLSDATPEQRNKWELIGACIFPMAPFTITTPSAGDRAGRFQ